MKRVAFKLRIKIECSTHMYMMQMTDDKTEADHSNVRILQASDLHVGDKHEIIDLLACICT